MNWGRRETRVNCQHTIKVVELKALVSDGNKLSKNGLALLQFLSQQNFRCGEISQLWKKK
jgi:hypothetical protein